ncbi:hypothetical protein B0H11DRAFT_2357472 [Mycena galericulata]|nr:hypothetical protein B0H11DRAFT_2357472 [Mycena galericulata]
MCAIPHIPEFLGEVREAGSKTRKNSRCNRERCPGPPPPPPSPASRLPPLVNPNAPPRELTPTVHSHSPPPEGAESAVAAAEYMIAPCASLLHTYASNIIHGARKKHPESARAMICTPALLENPSMVRITTAGGPGTAATADFAPAASAPTANVAAQAHVNTPTQHTIRATSSPPLAPLFWPPRPRFAPPRACQYPTQRARYAPFQRPRARRRRRFLPATVAAFCPPPPPLSPPATFTPTGDVVAQARVTRSVH